MISTSFSLLWNRSSRIDGIILFLPFGDGYEWRTSPISIASIHPSLIFDCLWLLAWFMKINSFPEEKESITSFSSLEPQEDNETCVTKMKQNSMRMISNPSIESLLTNGLYWFRCDVDSVDVEDWSMECSKWVPLNQIDGLANDWKRIEKLDSSQHMLRDDSERKKKIWRGTYYQACSFDWDSWDRRRRMSKRRNEWKEFVCLRMLFFWANFDDVLLELSIHPD